MRRLTVSAACFGSPEFRLKGFFVFRFYKAGSNRLPLYGEIIPDMMQCYGYLRRTPETAGYNAWLEYLNANSSDFRTMVNGFVNSVEYRLRFGRP